MCGSSVILAHQLTEAGLDEYHRRTLTLEVEADGGQAVRGHEHLRTAVLAGERGCDIASLLRGLVGPLLADADAEHLKEHGENPLREGPAAEEDDARRALGPGSDEVPLLLQVAGNVLELGRIPREPLGILDVVYEGHLRGVDAHVQLVVGEPVVRLGETLPSLLARPSSDEPVQAPPA